MKYYCMSCRTEIPEGDQLCPRCQSELEEYLYILGKHRHFGEVSRRQCRTLKGQAIAGDIKGAKKGLDRIWRRLG